MNQLALILDFGGGHSHLVAGKVREFGVYCEVMPGSASAEALLSKEPRAVILTGGNDEAPPRCPSEILALGVPVYTARPGPGPEDFGAELRGFLFDTAGFSGDWNMKDYVRETIESLRVTIGSGRVLCALSGGVDSTVAAVMTHRAAGDQLTCIFVDTGLMRKDEGDSVMAVCRDRFNMNVIRVNAQDRFLSGLAGVEEPERKRKIIGETFIRVFEEEARKIGEVDFFVQGTIYADVIESGDSPGTVIKSHHNVGGLPEVVDFKEIVEPLRMLFKAEVRRAGLELGIDEALVRRQPFPGPGLAIRVIGEVTEDKLRIVREADAIFRGEVVAGGYEHRISQYFAALTNMRSVGVRDGVRSYDYAVALRAVISSDFMTAEFARIPYEILARTSERIVREVPGVNRVLYDVTDKPPATVEVE